MNSLRDYIAYMRIDPTHTLNLLQDAGVISDLCITVDDVGNAGKAVAWLNLHEQELKPVSVLSVSSVVK
jgi:aryl-phospho-beta-D-glucosidase BglC (GH1 family)